MRAIREVIETESVFFALGGKMSVNCAGDGCEYIFLDEEFCDTRREGDDITFFFECERCGARTGERIEGYYTERPFLASLDVAPSSGVDEGVWHGPSSATR